MLYTRKLDLVIVGLTSILVIACQPEVITETEYVDRIEYVERIVYEVQTETIYETRVDTIYVNSEDNMETSLLWNTFGSGEVDVYQNDLFSGDYGAHGFNVYAYFASRVPSYYFTMHQFDGIRNDQLFEYIVSNNPNKTTVITSSLDNGSGCLKYQDPTCHYPIPEYSIEGAATLDDSRIVYVTSLENTGDDGTQYPHGITDYAIATTGMGLDQTIFVANIGSNVVYYDRDDEELFLDHMVAEVAPSTSFATPRVAARVARIIKEYPEFSAEQVKIHLFENYTEIREMEVNDGVNEHGTIQTITRNVRVLTQ